MRALSAQGAALSGQGAALSAQRTALRGLVGVGLFHCALSAVPCTLSAQAAPARDYYVFVASESVDRVALLRFGPHGFTKERERYVGANPTELVGPHGLAVSPDGTSWFVSTAHGTPYGRLKRYSTANDAAQGSVMLGNFPASMQVSPDGHLIWVVNFNLHGEMVPSDVSVVAAAELVEIARIKTCTMPHGSRLTADGSRHYSACMMDDALVEIDARKLEVSRHFMLGKGSEHGMSGPPEPHTGGGHETTCSPTWAQPTPNGATVWVACNRASDIVEIDAAAWTVKRRIPAGPGVYNLGVTHDGSRLIATNKRDASVSVFDARTGAELARIKTTRAVVHGIAVSDDDRYAFISVEGTGSQPGTVDVIDLRALTKVASADVGQQAGGIDFWKSEPPRGH